MTFRDRLEGSIAAHYLRKLFGTEEPLCRTFIAQKDSGSWTVCSIAAVIEGSNKPIRVAINGERIRIRCVDMRFDPPIEMDIKDFQAVMMAALTLGIKSVGDVVIERDDLTLRCVMPERNT